MKTAAILNFWDCGELLPYAVKNWFKCVDEVIIIYSDKSNYGEFLDNTNFLTGSDYDLYKRCLVVRCEPINLSARENEQRKRNFGLDIARQSGVTHFIMADADEFYFPEIFKLELRRFKDVNLKGLVCGCQTYFSSPKLTIGLDTTLITFIHKLTHELRFTWNEHFPFAWRGRSIMIDPTRQLNINNGVEWSHIVCHHYSWVRKDYQKKIRNSTARANLERSTILNDLVEAKEGGFCQYYQKTLVRASVDFNIPEYGSSESGDTTLCQDL